MVLLFLSNMLTGEDSKKQFCAAWREKWRKSNEVFGGQARFIMLFKLPVLFNLLGNDAIFICNKISETHLKDFVKAQDRL